MTTLLDQLKDVIRKISAGELRKGQARIALQNALDALDASIDGGNPPSPTVPDHTPTDENVTRQNPPKPTHNPLEPDALISVGMITSDKPVENPKLLAWLKQHRTVAEWDQ